MGILHREDFAGQQICAHLPLRDIRYRREHRDIQLDEHVMSVPASAAIPQ